MDHDAGRSTASASKTFGDSVASCTISFQGHREVAQLYAALSKHALRTTGVLIQFGSLTGFVRRSEVLSLLLNRGEEAELDVDPVVVVVLSLI